jgi:hypothetical protein
MNWKTETVPTELRGVLAALKGVLTAPSGPAECIALRFEPVHRGLCEVERSRDGATVRYGSIAQACRALGALRAGLVPRQGVYREETPFATLGVMLDCSRNAVMAVDHIVGVWLPRLALLGYNQVMLYTEDTYELLGEPYFGHQRGAYTADELRQVVAAADRLGIEVVPCIQTLGHLEQILRHGVYRPVRDTASVLMVGEPKTYELIDKMVAHWASVIRTRRIHIGMDETHDLGRGRYLDTNGYRNGFELFNEHLAKVADICRKHGLKPMIWSDMYFRLGSKTNEYYDRKSVIPSRVARGIPKDVDLVYWDYYHGDADFYLDWIARHRKLGKEPLMGSGIWTWNMPWYSRRLTEANAGACVRACYEAKLKEVLFTMWGDNGAFCDHDSAFAGMVYCADLAYGAKEPSAARLEKRFAGVCGGSYAAHRLASDLCGGVEGLSPNLWDDPFGETAFRTWAKDDARLRRSGLRMERRPPPRRALWLLCGPHEGLPRRRPWRLACRPAPHPVRPRDGRRFGRIVPRDVAAAQQARGHGRHPRAPRDGGCPLPRTRPAAGGVRGRQARHACRIRVPVSTGVVLRTGESFG